MPTVKITTFPWVCEGNSFVFTNESFIDNTIFNDILRPINSPNTQTWIYNNTLDNDAQPWILTATDPPGIYQISLGQESDFKSDYNNEYCSSIVSQDIEIIETPNITFIDTSFKPADKCGEDVIYTFDVTHNNVDTWEYVITSDNNPSFSENTVEDFIFPFSFPGIYDLTINLSNNNGCNDTLHIEIRIFPNPLADFTTNPDEQCEELPIIFTDNSTIPNNALYDNLSSIKYWKWDYGDGESVPDTTFIPNHEYTYET